MGPSLRDQGHNVKHPCVVSIQKLREKLESYLLNLHKENQGFETIPNVTLFFRPPQSQ